MQILNCRPRWSEFARGGIVEQDITCEGEETKIRSIRVYEWSEIRVGSVTTCVKLNEEVTEQSLE